MSVRTNFALVLMMLLPVTGHASPFLVIRQWSPPPGGHHMHGGRPMGAMHMDANPPAGTPARAPTKQEK